MPDQPSNTTGEDFEAALKDAENSTYVLKLYIAGNTARSAMAIENLRKVCEEQLTGRYQLEVIDINQQPGLAREGQVIATPTLIRVLPLPIRRIIGDLSKSQRILVGLDLIKK